MQPNNGEQRPSLETAEAPERLETTQAPGDLEAARAQTDPRVATRAASASADNPPPRDRLGHLCRRDRRVLVLRSAEAGWFRHRGEAPAGWRPLVAGGRRPAPGRFARGLHGPVQIGLRPPDRPDRMARQLRDHDGGPGRDEAVRGRRRRRDRAHGLGVARGGARAAAGGSPDGRVPGVPVRRLHAYSRGLRFGALPGDIRRPRAICDHGRTRDHRRRRDPGGAVDRSRSVRFRQARGPLDPRRRQDRGSRPPSGGRSGRRRVRGANGARPDPQPATHRCSAHPAFGLSTSRPCGLAFTRSAPHRPTR